MRKLKFKREYWELFFTDGKCVEIRDEAKAPGKWLAVDAANGEELGIIKLAKGGPESRAFKFLHGIDARRDGFDSADKLKTVLENCYPGTTGEKIFYIHGVDAVARAGCKLGGWKK